MARGIVHSLSIGARLEGSRSLIYKQVQDRPKADLKGVS